MEGVIDTLAWEGFREGVDDVRYITTLEDIMKKHPADSSPSVHAKELLRKLRIGIVEEPGKTRCAVITNILSFSEADTSGSRAFLREVCDQLPHAGGERNSPSLISHPWNLHRQ
jgi:hypothetical protein